MKTKRMIKLAAVLFFLISGVKAQDVIYTQFYANPIYLNPALAGSKLCHRLTLSYRNQWPSVKKGFVSYTAAWDQQYDRISGALGAIVHTGVYGGGIYNQYSGAGMYSYRLQAGRNMVLNAALQAGYFQYKLDWSKLVFGDQLNAETGEMMPTHESLPPKLKVGNVDLGFGLLGGYKESFYFGLAVNHLTRPDISFYNGNEYRMKMRWTIHSGILIDFFQGMDGEDLRNFSISPNVVYVQQGNFRQLNLGMYMNKYPLVAGVWFRHNFGNPDSFIVSLGFQQKKYKFGYSFDYTLNRLTIASGGAHEVSIAWLFPSYLSSNRFHEFRSPSF